MNAALAVAIAVSGVTVTLAAGGEHWAFVPPERPESPAVRPPALARGPVDRFVLARLDRAGLEPRPEAARETLIRRLTLDLTGLPPTAGEVSDFLSDDSPDAFSRLVDRLLADPAHGEHMATGWLDAARYADTSGYQTDGPRFMWRWRDWVIDALNAGMPFDRFTVEQIAGDMLPDADMRTRLATGFNRNHRGNAEGGIIAEEYQVEYVVDRVDTTATVWLGLTLQCARCHDHKFDPFTQRDFYGVFAYFNNIPEYGKALKLGNSPPVMAAPLDHQTEELRALDSELGAAKRELAATAVEASRAQSSWERALARGEIASVDTRFRGVPGALVSLELDGDAPSFEPARIGSGLRLDGSDVLDAGDVADFGYLDAFSVAAWVLPDDVSDAAIVSKTGDPEFEPGWELRLRDGHVQVNLVKRWLDDAIRVETREAIPAGSWRHVTATYDGSRTATGIRVYLNGERAALRVLLDEINQSFNSSEPLRIGGRGQGSRLRGVIDDVRIYSRELTGEDAAVLATTATPREIAGTPASAREAGARAKLFRAFLRFGAEERLRHAHRRSAELRSRREALVASFPTVMVMKELPEPRPTFLLERGRYDRPGERVEAALPAALPPLPAGERNDRLGFARWLVHESNPLTARVAVNRAWQHLFGAGLVRTPEDFGTQGRPPTHPLLLDWLATELRRAVWDTKTLLREIVTSATYRRDSRVTERALALDPENLLLARAPRPRLSARAIRDQALALGGLLQRRIGGPSVKPYQPPGIWKEVSGLEYERDHGEALYRRGLYTYWKRTATPPSMTALDASDREWCTVRPSRTNTPLQALALMNDVTFVEAARGFARRVLELETSRDARVSRLFRDATARRPTASERKVLESDLAAHLERYRREPVAARALCQVGETVAPPELDVVELAAWTALASTVLNLDEVITRG